MSSPMSGRYPRCYRPWGRASAVCSWIRRGSSGDIREEAHPPGFGGPSPDFGPCTACGWPFSEPIAGGYPGSRRCGARTAAHFPANHGDTPSMAVWRVVISDRGWPPIEAPGGQCYLPNGPAAHIFAANPLTGGTALPSLDVGLRVWCGSSAGAGSVWPERAVSPRRSGFPVDSQRRFR